MRRVATTENNGVLHFETVFSVTKNPSKTEYNGGTRRRYQRVCASSIQDIGAKETTDEEAEMPISEGATHRIATQVAIGVERMAVNDATVNNTISSFVFHRTRA